MVRDVMLQAVENRFVGALKAESEVEWLSDNGSCYIAHDTLQFSRKIGPKPVTTPVRSRKAMGWPRASLKR